MQTIQAAMAVSGLRCGSLQKGNGARWIAIGATRGRRVWPVGLSKRHGEALWRRNSVPNSPGRYSWSTSESSAGDRRVEIENLYSTVFGAGFEKEVGPDLAESIRNLPGTKDYYDYMMRISSAAKWKRCLEKGILPRQDAVSWPDEPFRSTFADTLQNLEMLSFTRRYPKLTKSLMGKMIELAHEFEEKMSEMENEQGGGQDSEDASPTSQMAQALQSLNGSPGQSQDGSPGQSQDGSPGQSQDGSPGQSQDGSPSQEGDAQPSENGNGNAQSVELTIQLGNQPSNGNRRTNNSMQSEATKAEMERIAEGIVKEFEEEMEPVMDNLKAARDIFPNLEGLIDERRGFGLLRGIWRRTGWREMEKLRKMLEEVKELRDLVRTLGRSGGRGPKRKARAQEYKSHCPPGVLRSPLQPEETSGLCRSGDLSRMLPPEAALLAAGWPKDGADGEENEKRKRLSKAARRLHLVRRAERNLFSYERTGWLEDEPARMMPHLEYRPAAEQGPIVICLDTSGSMQGARETVAKAVVLECLRGAHQQQRSCYLYTFSSFEDIDELELSVDTYSLHKLLDFLEHSFCGGTDISQALHQSLDRVKQKEWSQADILIVTDGEMMIPPDFLLDEIREMHEELGLETHGLLVGNSDSDAMEAVCSHLHVFKAWSAADKYNLDI